MGKRKIRERRFCCMAIELSETERRTSNLIISFFRSFLLRVGLPSPILLLFRLMYMPCFCIFVALLYRTRSTRNRNVKDNAEQQYLLPLDTSLKYLTLLAFVNRPGVCSDILRLVRLNLMMFLSTTNTLYFHHVHDACAGNCGLIGKCASSSIKQATRRVSYDDCLQRKREHNNIITQPVFIHNRWFIFWFLCVLASFLNYDHFP